MKARLWNAVHVTHMVAACVWVSVALVGCSRRAEEERAAHGANATPSERGHTRAAMEGSASGEKHAMAPASACTTPPTAAAVARQSSTFAALLGEAHADGDGERRVAAIVHAVTNGLLSVDAALEAFLPLRATPSNAIEVCNALLAATSMGVNQTANVITIKAIALADVRSYHAALALCTDVAEQVAGESAYAACTLYSTAGDIARRAGLPLEEPLRYYQRACTYTDPRVYPASSLENFGAASRDAAMCLIRLGRYVEARRVIDDALAVLPKNVSWHGPLQRLRAAVARRCTTDEQDNRSRTITNPSRAHTRRSQ